MIRTIITDTGTEWRPTTFKRYSPNGVIRLFSWLPVKDRDGERREWTLVAKRKPPGPWARMPRARRDAA